MIDNARSFAPLSIKFAPGGKSSAAIADKAHELTDEDLARIAEQAGIGAVKYADLSTSRIKDYVFDVERMVSFNGNTGVYLQYAHTRICSILRKAAADGATEVDPTLPIQRAPVETPASPGPAAWQRLPPGRGWVNVKG